MRKRQGGKEKGRNRDKKLMVLKNDDFMLLYDIFFQGKGSEGSEVRVI